MVILPFLDWSYILQYPVNLFINQSDNNVFINLNFDFLFYIIGIDWFLKKETRYSSNFYSWTFISLNKREWKKDKLNGNIIMIHERLFLFIFLVVKLIIKSLNMSHTSESHLDTGSFTPEWDLMNVWPWDVWQLELYIIWNLKRIIAILIGECRLKSPRLGIYDVIFRWATVIWNDEFNDTGNRR